MVRLVSSASTMVSLTRSALQLERLPQLLLFYWRNALTIVNAYSKHYEVEWTFRATVEPRRFLGVRLCDYLGLNARLFEDLIPSSPHSTAWISPVIGVWRIKI